MRHNEVMLLFRIARHLLGMREADRIAKRSWNLCMLVVIPLAFVFSYVKDKMILWAGIGETWSISKAALVVSMLVAGYSGWFVGLHFVMLRQLRRALARRGFVFVVGDWRHPVDEEQSRGRLDRPGRREL